jgi:hypothetical protein
MNTAVVAQRVGEVARGALNHGPVPAGAIAAAERELGVRFPPSLRCFLSQFGASLGDGFELAGIPVSDRESPNGPLQWRDLVTETHRARKAASLPSRYIVIGDDGSESTYLLDTGQVGPDGECPVVALGPGREFVVVSPSFIEFAERLKRRENP